MHYEQQTIFRHGSSDKLERKSQPLILMNPANLKLMFFISLCFLQY